MSIPHIHRGSEVFFRIQVYDQRVEPPVLFDPATSMQIKITDPEGTIVVMDASMTNESTGVYTYVYQTDPADPFGAWLVRYRIRDGSSIMTTLPEVAFITESAE